MSVFDRLRRWWREWRRSDESIPQLARWQEEQERRLEMLAAQRRLMERRRRWERPRDA